MLNSSSKVKRWGMVCACAALAMIPLAPAAVYAAGDELGQTEGFWPQLHTNATIVNGWVVITALVDGFTNNVQWRVPLIPSNGGPVMIQHGVTNTYVQIGNREFVIANGTGRAFELRNGQLWRNVGPGAAIMPPVPVQSTYPPPTVSYQAPVVPPPNYPSVEGPVTYKPSTDEDVRTTLKYRGVSDAEQRVLEQQQLVQNELAAYSELLIAIDRLEEIRRLYALNQANAADLGDARRSVAEARDQVILTVRAAAEHFAVVSRAAQGIYGTVPSLAATTQPSAFVPSAIVPSDILPPLSAEQKYFLNQTDRRIASLNREISDLSDRLAGACETCIDEATANGLRDRLDDLNRQLVTAESQANVQRMMYRQSVNIYEVAPDLRCHMAGVQQNLIDLDVQLQTAQRQMRELSALVQTDPSRKPLLADASSTVMTLLHKREAARQELKDLVDIAASHMPATVSPSRLPPQTGLLTCPVEPPAVESDVK